LMLLCDIKLVYLRTNFLNREYAFATNLQTILLVVFSIIGACLFAAPGLLIGQSLAYLLSYLSLCIKFPFRFSSSIKLTKAKKIDFWGIAGISAFNNGIGHALTLVGTFFVGLLLTNDELVANYQVATYIPFGLLFIPSAVM